MSVVPKPEPEVVRDAKTNAPFPFDLVSDKNCQSVDQPQSQTVLEQVSPSRARALVVFAWIAAIAAVAGFTLWAALANPA
jgi:hypothetical protein